MNTKSKAYIYIYVLHYKLLSLYINLLHEPLCPLSSYFIDCLTQQGGFVLVVLFLQNENKELKV